MSYRVIRERIIDEDIGTYVAYGIELRSKGKTVRKISDIFLSYRKIKHLCRLCNKLKPDNGQIDYIVQDCIEEYM